MPVLPFGTTSPAIILFRRAVLHDSGCSQTWYFDPQIFWTEIFSGTHPHVVIDSKIVSLILNYNNFFCKNCKKYQPKVPITCEIDSRSKSKSFLSLHSYNNLLFLDLLKCVKIRCRSIVLTRSFSNGIRQREVSLSVVVSDLSLVLCVSQNMSFSGLCVCVTLTMKNVVNVNGVDHGGNLVGYRFST